MPGRAASLVIAVSSLRARWPSLVVRRSAHFGSRSRVTKPAAPHTVRASMSQSEAALDNSLLAGPCPRMGSHVVSVIESLPPTISVERAGELLGVSRRAAYRAATRGQIPTLRVGRRLLVPTQRLLDLLGMGDTGDSIPPVSPRFVIEDIRPEGSTTPTVKAVHRRDRSQIDLAPRPTLAQE